LSGAKFLAQKSPEIVCQPGSAWTRWGAYSTPPDLLAGLRGLLLKGGEGRKKREWMGRATTLLNENPGTAL